MALTILLPYNYIFQYSEEIIVKNIGKKSLYTSSNFINYICLSNLGNAIEMRGVLALVSHLSADENILLTVTTTTVEMIKVSSLFSVSLYSYSFVTMRPLVGSGEFRFKFFLILLPLNVFCVSKACVRNTVILS